MASISGARMDQASQQFSFMELCMLESGLQRRYNYPIPILSTLEEVQLIRDYQVVEYITYRLISGYNAGDNITQSFVDNYDFYIFPIVNPDGTKISPTPPLSNIHTNLIPRPQASSTPKPPTANGAKTANLPLPPQTQPASAATSTATGPSPGTRTAAAPRPTPVRKPMPAKAPLTPPRTLVSSTSSRPSTPQPGSVKASVHPLLSNILKPNFPDKTLHRLALLRPRHPLPLRLQRDRAAASTPQMGTGRLPHECRYPRLIGPCNHVHIRPRRRYPV